MVTAPFSDLLREPRFRGKRVRKLKVPWGEFQQQAKDALIKALTSPSILALPDWNKLLRPHSDASEIGAGAVLTQFSDHLKNILIYASHQWSVTDAKQSSYGPGMSRNTWGCGQVRVVRSGQPVHPYHGLFGTHLAVLKPSA